MIGPTGVGKTEISRRLAKLADAPFTKVEATKFTEVGYVGRDVEQIIRDLIESAISMVRDKRRLELRPQAHIAAEDRVLDALVGSTASEATRDSFRKKLRAGELDDREIELELADTSNPFGGMEMPGGGGSVGMINLSDMLGKAMGGRTRKRKLNVVDSFDALVAEEADKLIDDESITRDAVHAVEENGIVFLDEIDKIAARKDAGGADVSREGVQRDLLPLIEGTTVSTKHGQVKTDHILFIASGAFHVSKPSDLLPELQGRLPIRVELRALTKDDFRRILTEPDNSLIKQYAALMAAEDVTLTFSDDGVDASAELSAEINTSVENIGARRLHTVMERILDDLSYAASDKGGESIEVNRAYVEEQIGDLARNVDLSRYVL